MAKKSISQFDDNSTEKYNKLLNIVNQYWVDGDRGKLATLLSDKWSKRKGYLLNLISHVKNGRKKNINLLLEMYEFIKHRIDTLNSIIDKH